MVARSVFERLEASGFRELKLHLTEEARAHAFARPCRHSSLSPAVPRVTLA